MKNEMFIISLEMFLLISSFCFVVGTVAVENPKGFELKITVDSNPTQTGYATIDTFTDFSRYGPDVLSSIKVTYAFMILDVPNEQSTSNFMRINGLGEATNGDDEMDWNLDIRHNTNGKIEASTRLYDYDAGTSRDASSWEELIPNKWYALVFAAAFDFSQDEEAEFHIKVYDEDGPVANLESFWEYKGATQNPHTIQKFRTRIVGHSAGWNNNMEARLLFGPVTYNRGAITVVTQMNLWPQFYADSEYESGNGIGSYYLHYNLDKTVETTQFNMIFTPIEDLGTLVNNVAGSLTLADFGDQTNNLSRSNSQVNASMHAPSYSMTTIHGHFDGIDSLSREYTLNKPGQPGLPSVTNPTINSDTFSEKIAVTGVRHIDTVINGINLLLKDIPQRLSNKMVNSLNDFISHTTDWSEKTINFLRDVLDKTFLMMKTLHDNLQNKVEDIETNLREGLRDLGKAIMSDIIYVLLDGDFLELFIKAMGTKLRGMLTNESNLLDLLDGSGLSGNAIDTFLTKRIHVEYKDGTTWKDIFKGSDVP